MGSASGQVSWYMPNPIDISPHADSLKVFGVFANAIASLSMITSTQKPKYVAISIIISLQKVNKLIIRGGVIELGW